MEDKRSRKKVKLIKLIKQNITLRLTVQAFVVIVMFYAAWHFYGFYEYVQGYEGNNTPYRPPVVEGFLPVAALVAFKAMFVMGEIDPIHPAGLIIFMAVLLTGWIFRRSLCSWICPLGTFSEYLGKLGQKLMGRNFKIPKWLDMLLLGVKYVLFIYITKTFLLLPAGDAVSFMKLPYYTISDIKMFELFLHIGITGLLVIMTLMVLSFLFKSFWCRYLCPYGALLGIIGLFSPIILKKNDNTCLKCGQCNKVCPGAINIKDKQHAVISTECTGCTSCVSACPQKDTLQFKVFGILPIKPFVFALSFLAVFFGVIIAAMLAGYWESSATWWDYRETYKAMSGGL